LKAGHQVFSTSIDGSADPIIFSNNGKWMIFQRVTHPYGDRFLDVLDLEKGIVARSIKWKGEGYGVGHAAFSPDDKYMIGGSSPLVELATGKEVTLPPGHPGDPPTIQAFLADCRSLRTVATDGTVVTFDVHTGREQSRLKLPFPKEVDYLNRLGFYDHGRVVLCAEQGRIDYWDADTGKLLGYFPQGPTNHSIAYMYRPFGQAVAVNVDGTRQSALRVFRLPPVAKLTRPGPGA